MRGFWRGSNAAFLCRLAATDFVRLRARLHDVVDLQEDQVLLIPFCGRCVGGIEAMGWPAET